MSVQELVDEIVSLTPAERESVSQFVDFLKHGEQRLPSPFLVAADEFIDRHPELLRRLAQ
jgi:ABC-type nitrate/sulfonate/bicarbonate transport system substrate-binding protein